MVHNNNAMVMMEEIQHDWKFQHSQLYLIQQTQQNLYKVTIKFHGLSRQVVFHEREKC